MKKFLIAFFSLVFLFLIFLVGATISSVTLVSPDNNFWTSDTTPDFTFNAVSDNNNSFFCELFIDDTGYGSNSSTENSTNTIITASPALSDGSYSWYVNCTDANNTLNSSTRTINIDNTDPTATQGTNPIDNYNSSASVTFDIKCSDNLAVNSLQLWADWGGSWSAKETNSSPINNTYWNVTVSSIPGGTWNWAAWCDDSAGNSDYSGNRTLNVESTGPSINLILSDNSIRLGRSITVTCTASDASGIQSISVTSSDGTAICSTNTEDCTGGYEPNSIGDKTITCTAYDTSSNSGSDASTLEVRSRWTGSSAPPVPIVCGNNVCEYSEDYLTCPEDCEAPAEAPTEIDYDLEILTEYEDSFIEFSATTDEVIKFVVKGTEHTSQIAAITSDSVTIWIWSDPIKVTLTTGSTKEIDLDANGKNEFAITLVDIDGSNCELIFKEIIEVEEVEEEPEVEEETKLGWWFWVILVVIVILILIFVILPLLKKKPSKRK